MALSYLIGKEESKDGLFAADKSVLQRLFKLFEKTLQHETTQYGE